MEDRSKDERALRNEVRYAIELGVLPVRPPSQCWGGHGTGEPCLICKAVVGPSEMGIEVELETDGAGSMRKHLHVACFAAWELESAQLLARPRVSDAVKDKPPSRYTRSLLEGSRESSQ